MFKILAAFVFMVFSAFAQVELVDNQWPNDPQGHKFFPDAQVRYVGRAFYNSGAPIVGWPFKYPVIKQYAGMGYHTHETSDGCCIVTRPSPVFLPPGYDSGITDAAGYAIADVQLNGYAGWYTVCVDVFVPGNVLPVFTRCVNNNTKYYTRILGADINLARYAGGTPGHDYNQPQTLHWDRRHACASQTQQLCSSEPPVLNSDGYTNRWSTDLVSINLTNASLAYVSATATAGRPDMLDVTRISLPDGGVYDDDALGVAPGAGQPPLNSTLLNWNTRVFEEHARGTEVDITVAPIAANVPIEFTKLYGAGCNPGRDTPIGSPIVPTYPVIDDYWKTQGVIHVTRGHALRHTPLPPPH